MDSAIVTGANAGLGLAIARKLIDLGFRVYGLGGNYAETAYKNRDFLTYSCDLGSAVQVETRVREILAREGAVFAVVNNAKRFLTRPLEDCSASEIEVTLAVNLTCPLWILRLCLPGLRQLGGHVINIVANAPEHARGGLVGAAASGGLRWLSEAFFEEARDEGVRVTNLFPQANRRRPEGSPPPPAERPNSAIDPEAVATAVGSLLLDRSGNLVSDLVIRPQRLTEKPAAAPLSLPYPNPAPDPFLQPYGPATVSSLLEIRETLAAQEPPEPESEPPPAPAPKPAARAGSGRSHARRPGRETPQGSPEPIPAEPSGEPIPAALPREVPATDPSDAAAPASAAARPSREVPAVAPAGDVQPVPTVSGVPVPESSGAEEPGERPGRRRRSRSRRRSAGPAPEDNAPVASAPGEAAVAPVPAPSSAPDSEPAGIAPPPVAESVSAPPPPVPTGEPPADSAPALAPVRTPLPAPRPETGESTPAAPLGSPPAPADPTRQPSTSAIPAPVPEGSSPRTDPPPAEPAPRGKSRRGRVPQRERPFGSVPATELATHPAFREIRVYPGLPTAGFTAAPPRPPVAPAVPSPESSAPSRPRRRNR